MIDFFLVLIFSLTPIVIIFGARFLAKRPVNSSLFKVKVSYD